MKRTAELKADPAKTAAWQQQSRRNLPRTSKAPAAQNPKRTRGLRARSKKMAKVYREQRVPLVKALAADAGICPVPWCSNVADSPHEPLTRARGGSITDPSNVVMLCWPCNQALTLEPPWGYELGLLRHSWEK